MPRCVGPEAITGYITDRFDELRRWTTMGRQPPCPRTIQRVLKGTGAAAGALLDLVGPLRDRDILALDGKVVRGASKRRHHVHVVTAWSTIQLPTSCGAISEPKAISIRRDMLLH